INKISLPFPISAGTAVSLIKGRILLFGGDKGETFHKTETLIAAYNTEKDSLQKINLNEQKIKIQINHPGFSNQVLMYNVVSGETKNIGSIPFTTPVTTMACKWDDLVLLPCGEIKAGIRTPQILMGKLNTKLQ
ncbi:MAG: hypothetical protein WCG67_03170, partial [Ferruginibacter sp.]